MYNVNKKLNISKSNLVNLIYFNINRNVAIYIKLIIHHKSNFVFEFLIYFKAQIIYNNAGSIKLF